MTIASDRRYTRRDTALFILCLSLSMVALFSPATWGSGIAATLRETVLAPLVWLQARAEEGRTSRVRFRVVTAERDSTAYLAQFLPSLRAENERLRQLLRLSHRLTTSYVAGEVLHQPQATDSRTLLLSVGARQGVAPFNPVVAPEGLIGVILSVSRSSSIAMSWAHPEFRVSAFTVGGNAFGVAAPSIQGRNNEGALEFRGVPYRDSVPLGTLVLSSGLGGVFPKGIPVGTVIGTVREEAGWERVYRLRPAANPGSAAHVLVLTGSRGGDLSSGFPSDSQLEAMRLDSLARVQRADSVAQAARAARAGTEGLPGPDLTDTGRHPEQPGSRTAAGLQPMSPRRVTRAQLVLVLLCLLVLQFYLRPRLWNARVSPDFLLIGLMLFAMRSGAGAGALVGFLVGLIADTLTPARFGAATLAHTIVGYLAAWGRAVFFADNMLVNAAFVAVGLWLRDLIVLVASGTDHKQLLTELTFYSPVQALTTAACALVVLVTFRAVFSVRLDA